MWIWHAGRKFIARKPCRPDAAKKTAQECGNLYRSRKEANLLSTDKSMRHVVGQVKKGGGMGAVAEGLSASQRHIPRLWTGHPKTDDAHVRGREGRPKKPPPSYTGAGVSRRPLPHGARLAAAWLRGVGCVVECARACATLESRGRVAASPAKSRRRKRAGHESSSLQRRAAHAGAP